MFEKSTTVFISDEYKDGSKIIPKDAIIVKCTSTEDAIARAYVSYLCKEGMKLTSLDQDILIEQIENSLKEHKSEAQKISIV